VIIGYSTYGTGRRHLIMILADLLTGQPIKTQIVDNADRKLKKNRKNLIKSKNCRQYKA